MTEAQKQQIERSGVMCVAYLAEASAWEQEGCFGTAAMFAELAEQESRSAFQAAQA